jgi:membrane-associated phospholipid phosphatase
MKFKVLPLFLLLFIFNISNAQENYSFKDKFASSDTSILYSNTSLSSFSRAYQPYISVYDTIPAPSTKWYATDTGKSLIASGALIGLGLYTYKDEGFLNRVTIKEQINRYLPGFENTLDDYTQYIPYAGIYILDAAGVKSKHKTLRKTTSVATGLLLNLIVVQGLKYTIAEPRPDGSSNNSFPSGHTTTAFMGAHVFHKEYGERSPYYSIGGYLLASVTGFFRQLNDRHWSSDVLVGAGLGISLTELSYYLNGLYYGDEGINEIEYTESVTNYNKPSFLEAKASFASLIDDINTRDSGLIAKNGFSVDIEGAYFFNKYIGAGGNVGIQSFPVEIDQNIKNAFENQGFDINSETVGNSKYSLGPFVQYPFGKSTVGGKFLLGYSTISDTEIRLSPIDGDVTEADDITYAQVSPKGGLIWSTGIYFKHLLSDKLYIGLYADYNNIATDLEVSTLTDLTNDVPSYDSSTIASSFNSYNIGGNIGVMLW